MATINQFKANLIGAGPRNNRFEVFIPRAGNKIQFLCKTASLPGQTITPTEMKYKGLTVKLAGDRTFEDWAVTIYNDTEWSARTAIEDWMDECGYKLGYDWDKLPSMADFNKIKVNKIKAREYYENYGIRSDD